MGERPGPNWLGGKRGIDVLRPSCSSLINSQREPLDCEACVPVLEGAAQDHQPYLAVDQDVFGGRRSHRWGRIAAVVEEGAQRAAVRPESGYANFCGLW